MAYKLTEEDMQFNEYQCALCRGTFLSDWSETDALEEYDTLFPEVPNDPKVSLCDDCHKSFIEWFEKLSEGQKQKMWGQNGIQAN